tara:strand:- start:244 stop:1047 length:804 start_codon:yes stop_codon:yes gene_type:complete
MGMFDKNYTFNPNDVTVATSEGYTSAPMQLAFQGSRMLSQAAGNALGYLDEEQMLQQIYESADLSTDEGRIAAVEQVLAINPEKGAELQKMLTNQSIGKAQLATANLATETAQVQNATIKYGTKLANEFTTTVQAGGQKDFIANWFQINNIPLPANPPTTYVMATKYINEHFSGDGEATVATAHRTDLKEELNKAKDNWIQQGVMRIVAGEEAPKTYTASEAFDVSLEDEMNTFQNYVTQQAAKRKTENDAKRSGYFPMANMSFTGM